MLKRTAAKDDIEGRIDQSIKLFELIGLQEKIMIHLNLEVTCAHT